MNPILPNFLNDPSDYESAQALWQEHWDKILCASGQEGDWRSPWLNHVFVNGTPCRDGNPIFSAVCDARGIGVRVIQNEPDDTETDFIFWTDTFAAGQPEAIRELVISCVLSQKTLQDAMDVMRRWVTGQELGSNAHYGKVGT
jgi:hypothetical protein